MHIQTHTTLSYLIIKMASIKTEYTKKNQAILRPHEDQHLHYLPLICDNNPLLKLHWAKTTPLRRDCHLNVHIDRFNQKVNSGVITQKAEPTPLTRERCMYIDISGSFGRRRRSRVFTSEKTHTCRWFTKSPMHLSTISTNLLLSQSTPRVSIDALWTPHEPSRSHEKFVGAILVQLPPTEISTSCHVPARSQSHTDCCAPDPPSSWLLWPQAPHPSHMDSRYLISEGTPQVSMFLIFTFLYLLISSILFSILSKNSLSR